MNRRNHNNYIWMVTGIALAAILTLITVWAWPSPAREDTVAALETPTPTVRPLPTPTAREVVEIEEEVPLGAPGELNAPDELVAVSEKKEPQEPSVEIPDIGVDEDTLVRMGPAAIGWLYSPNTKINCAVMGAEDYEYYMNRAPDGKTSSEGSLFIDYHCEWDLWDNLTIVYGKDRSDGSMFGSLSKYKKQSYYDEHPYMYYYSPYGNYRVELVYGFRMAGEKWDAQQYTYEEDTSALLKYARRNTTFKSGLKVGKYDKLMLLSTHSYDAKRTRYVLLGVMRPEYD